MGRPTLFDPHLRQPDAAEWARHRTAFLTEIYGEAVPATALVLDDHLRTGRILLRAPGATADCVVSVDLCDAACAFGSDLAETHRYLHRLHATGQLTVDEHGTVDMP